MNLGTTKISSEKEVKTAQSIGDLLHVKVKIAGDWLTKPEDVYTVERIMEEFPEQRDTFSKIDGNPVIILAVDKEGKPLKNQFGKSFNIMKISVKDDMMSGYFCLDLPFNNYFAVGDIIDVKTLRICKETKFGKVHLYATGELYDETAQEVPKKKTTRKKAIKN